MASRLGVLMAIKMYDLAGAEVERRFSPFCWQIRMAVAHKGLELETIPWYLTDKATIAFSGQGRVPVIVDGNTTVVDSWKIVNYLESAYPNHPSLFGSDEARGEAMFIKKWCENTLAPKILPLVVLNVFQHLHPQDQAYFRKTREPRLGMTIEEFSAQPDSKLPQLHSILTPLQETLKQQSFLAGEKPNFSDYMVFSFFQWARCVSPYKLLQPEHPVFAWRERMLALYDGLAGKALGYDV